VTTRGESSAAGYLRPAAAAELDARMLELSAALEQRQWKEADAATRELPT
jgi:hypothetical protein